jgi:hypothetical protein
MNDMPQSHRTAARMFGFFFILAFLSYGTGSALVADLADGPDGLPGYTIFFIGILSELLGNPLGFWPMLPGSVFEIGLSLWLIIRGFSLAKTATQTT